MNECVDGWMNVLFPKLSQWPQNVTVVIGVKLINNGWTMSTLSLLRARRRKPRPRVSTHIYKKWKWNLVNFLFYLVKTMFIANV